MKKKKKKTQLFGLSSAAPGPEMSSSASAQAVAPVPNVSRSPFARGSAGPPAAGYNAHWHPKIESGRFIRHTVRLHGKEHGGRCQMGAAEIGRDLTRRCLAMGSAGRLASPAAGAPAPRAPTHRGEGRRGARRGAAGTAPGAGPLPIPSRSFQGTSRGSCPIPWLCQQPGWGLQGQRPPSAPHPGAQKLTPEFPT